MPTYTITSPIHPDGQFPDETDLRIEWVANQRRKRARADKTRQLEIYMERMLYWTGLVTGEFTKHFDPGKYLWKAHKHTEEGIEDFSCKGAFLIGMTEEEWRKVSHMQPKMQKARMTTDGVTFTCQFPGCSKKTTSKIAALLHESEDHYGVRLLENPESKKTLDKEIDAAVQKAGKRRGFTNPKEATA